MVDIEYKLIRNENKQAKYPWVVIKSYPGFVGAFYCSDKQKKAFPDLAQLYKEARKNGKA
jgi:hypothetical protein|nr:MAG: hypothetical protein [Bacteriophage sp.]